MKWLEVSVHTSAEAQDLVSLLLMETGAAGTAIQDRADVPDPNRPGAYWELYDPKMVDAMPEDVVVSAWFETDERLHDRLNAVRAGLRRLAETQGAAVGTLAVETGSVADEDWSEVWKQFYKPFRLGKRLLVKPSWEECAPREGDVVIELDPGMAFGTGTHETTGMCLELVEKYMRAGARVLDVGTGSGILAIAAKLLGAGETLAVDIDPDAVRVARENVAKNGLTGQIDVRQGDLLQGVAFSADVAVANIVADAILLLSPALLPHLAPEGVFLCSGIIRAREDDVRRGLRDAGYRVIDAMVKGEWVALAAVAERG